MSDNPLDQLIVDSDSLDKTKLVALIKDNLGLSKDGEVVILAGFNNLTTKSKILSILLAKKAAKVMGLMEKEVSSLKEVLQKTGLPSGTAGRELAELKKLRLILNDNGYYIPDYAVHQIAIEVDTKNKQNHKRTLRKNNRAGGNKFSSNTKKSEKTENLLQIPQESLSTEMIELLLRPGLTLERSLAVLKIARDNGIESLTPAEIAAFLKDKIRAGSVWKSNVSLSLGKKGTRYVDRFPDPTGNGFTYKIMAPGEQLLEQILTQKSTSYVEDVKVNDQTANEEAS